MASINQVVEGLTLLGKYYDKGDLCSVNADHDVLYAGGPGCEKVSAEDKARLDVLGWFYNEDYECWQHFA